MPDRHDVDLATDSIKQRLVRIERLLAIGFAEQVAAKRKKVDMDDDVSDAILLRTADWISAGPLKVEVETTTGQSSMTIKRRLNKLVELGALDRRGKGTSTAYRSTGLLG